MIENQNITNDVTVTEKDDGGNVTYELSPQDFAALTATATVLQLKVNETIQADTCVNCAERAEHWFKLTVLQTGDYSFSANTYGLISCRLYDVTRTELVSDNVGEEDTDFLINYTLLQGQVYYLQIIPNEFGFSRFNTVITGTEIPVESIRVTPSTLSLKTGETAILSEVFSPEIVTNEQVVWSSSNSNIVTVSADGKVLAQRNGTATIFATTTDGTDKQGQCSVCVEPMVTGISLNHSSKILRIDETEQLSVNITPSNAFNKDVTWRSSNYHVVDVYKDGTIAGLNIGTAIISATTKDGGYCATCIVTVDDRELVTVERDGDFNKIVFHTSGKEWLCLNYDMINDPENRASNPYDETYKLLKGRLNANTYATIINWDGLIDLQDPKSYTDKEKKLLYMIDPHGFAAYVQKYGAEIYSGDLAGLVNFKDSVFKTLFNQSPKYFARDNTGEWYDATAKKNQLSISKMLSESELLFGIHPVYDWTFGLQCIDVALKILALPVAFCELAYISVPVGYTMFLKYINLSFTLGRSLIEEDYKKYIETMIKELNGMFDGDTDTKSANFSMGWAKELFELSDGFEELADILEQKPTFYKEIFEYCATEPNYRICFQYKYGTVDDVSDISNKLN